VSQVQRVCAVGTGRIATWNQTKAETREVCTDMSTPQTESALRWLLSEWHSQVELGLVTQSWLGFLPKLTNDL